MAASREYLLELTPRHRFDLFDVNAALRDAHGDVLHGHRHALYASLHTTAGYLDEASCAAVAHTGDGVRALVERYRALYPAGAGYHHDRLEHRHELTETQKATEPLNADAHLSFFGAGLEGCVVYRAEADRPAWFVDLDGVGVTGPRTRRTCIVGFDAEREVARLSVAAPSSHRRIDAFNLRDPRLGLFDEIEALARQQGIAKGRVEVRLVDDDPGAALAINEYETLLMTHDLADVLHNPFRFAAEKSWHALRDLPAVKEKVKDYAKYDLVVLANDALDRLRLRGTPAERAVNALIRKAALRYLRMKRAVTLPISDHDRDGVGEIVQGTYQSPILVQWARPRAATRRLDVRLVSFE